MSYDLDDVILYSICPFKKLFKVSDKRPYYIDSSDEKNIIYYALKKTYCEYTSFISMKTLGNITSNKGLPAIFTRNLKVVRPSFGNKDFITEPDLIKKIFDGFVAYPKFIQDPSRELIAVNFPIEGNVFGSNVTSSVDIILYNKGTNTAEIYFFGNANQTDANMFGIKLKAAFCLSKVKRELATESMSIVCNILDVFSMKLTEIKLDQSNRFNYNRLIRSLIAGIDSKSYYPRPSFGACSTCLYRDKCNWEVKVND